MGSEQFFPDLSRWYGLFIEHFMPKLKPGHIVVNGENPPDTNVARIGEYILQLIETQMPRFDEEEYEA